MPKRAGITALVLTLALLFLSPPVLATSPESSTPMDPAAQAKADYQEALKRIQAGRNDEAIPLLERALKALPDDRHLQADYALCLVWTGAYQKAVEFYGPREKDLRQIRYIPRHMAKAYYELKEYPKALELYRLGLSYDPKDDEAFKGIVYTQMRMGDGAGAYTSWLEAKKSGQISGPALDAVKVVLLEQYGASLEALVVAKEGSVGGPAQLQSLELDRAVTKLRWGLVDEAIAEIEAILAKDPGNLRARGDYIVALRQKDRMKEALQQFEIYRQAGQPIPSWVSQAVADAYLYLRKPEEAEVYYKMTLEKDPDNFGATMGLFHIYSDLRQWEKATQTIGRLEELVEKEKKALAWNESVLARQRSLADSNSLISTKGWFLLYQDKLKKGQAYFDYYLGEAASETGLRSGLAHAYLWRNWPRRALEQFEINRNLDPQDVGSLTGLGWTLNTLNYKREARALADELHQRVPTHLNVYDLWETLKVEDMWHLQPGFRFTREFSGATEYTAWLLLEKPLTPLFSLNTEILRQEAWNSSQGQDVRVDWNRVGLGFRWIVMPELIWWQNLSFDYVKGGEFGSDTRLMWWPTDPLRITAGFNSFSLSVPIRARAQGITAENASLDVLYVESDLREYGAAVSTQWFSDNNVYIAGTARYDQNVYNTPDLKIRGGLALGIGTYSKQDVDYYSPQYEWSALLTSAIQWVNCIRYERKWMSAVYLRAGVSGEYGFSTYPVAGITFEQSYVHSKTFNVTGGISYDLKVYDGDYTNVVGAYVTLNWYF
jgi:biofilm PGA synthesis protein PgaA